MNDTRANVSVLSQHLVDSLWNDPGRYRVKTSTDSSGARLIDAGIDAPGGLESGRIIGEICMGGLGTVSLASGTAFKHWSLRVDVSASDPITACLGSQYAGWSLSHGEGKGAFHALGSGPARAMGSREPLFEELGFRNPAGPTTIVLEVDREPPAEVIAKIVDRCGINASDLTLILTPTTSIAGGMQIVARVLEVALHKVHELKFPLAQIIDGVGSAPVPPPSGDFMTAMGRTNDAILFGGQVHLFVDSDDDAARELADGLPSSASRDFGKPFGKIFKDCGYDFYKIDPMLFSPALCAITAVGSGKTFHAGSLREDLLDESFGA